MNQMINQLIDERLFCVHNNWTLAKNTLRIGSKNVSFLFHSIQIVTSYKTIFIILTFKASVDRSCIALGK
jgi:hypothetical protein